jgi:hypothetical protein
MELRSLEVCFMELRSLEVSSLEVGSLERHYPAGGPGPIGVWLCGFSEWALAAFFHELTVAAEVSEERQVPVP